MVQQTLRQRRRFGRTNGLPLEAKNVVADPDGNDASDLRRAPCLCFVNRFGTVYLFALLSDD